MPPIRCAQSSVRARLKRAPQSRRASLAFSTPLRKQSTPHRSKSTKYSHPLQIPPLFLQTSPARSPSRHPTALGPSHSVDTRPRIPDRAAQSQTPPPKLFPLRLPPPALQVLTPPRPSFRRLLPTPSPSSAPPAPR